MTFGRLSLTVGLSMSFVLCSRKLIYCCNLFIVDDIQVTQCIKQDVTTVQMTTTKILSQPMTSNL